MKTNKLHNIKSTGFKTPKDYFEIFDNKVLSKLNDERLLDDIQDTGFKVAQGYFNTLEDNIIAKINNENQPKVISLFSKKNIIYASSIAAAILILLSITINNNNPSFDSLEIQNVENYIIDENISTYEIASLLTEDALHDDIYIDHDLEKENIEAYLLNHADIEDLIIE